jgi:ribosomal protein S18 acetylase RimI-like enzyme
MKLVTHISAVTNAYNYAKGYKKGFITNCFITTKQFNKLISNDILHEITIGEVVFLLKKNEDFSNLYYYAASIDELAQALPLLLPVIAKETVMVDIVTKNELCEEKSVFEENHFNIYTSLIRMSSVGNKFHEKLLNSPKVRNATTDDVIVLNEMIKSYFDPRAEQLPEMDDLSEWIRNGSIILFEDQKKIIGFIIYDLNATTLYLRYWFVHPDYRDLKIGSKLFNEFLSRGKNTQRQLFWVIKTNQNAIKRYRHYGFEEEKMSNFILTNKNLSYEE